MIGRIGLLVALLLVIAPAPARAQERLALTEFALGTTCALLNLGYGPLKVVYATLGTLTGSAAWLLTAGDSEVAGALIQPALRGDYAIVPEHLTLERPLEFHGRRPSRW